MDVLKDFFFQLFEKLIPLYLSYKAGKAQAEANAQDASLDAIDRAKKARERLEKDDNYQKMIREYFKK